MVIGSGDDGQDTVEEELQGVTWGAFLCDGFPFGNLMKTELPLTHDAFEVILAQSLE